MSVFQFYGKITSSTTFIHHKPGAKQALCVRFLMNECVLLGFCFAFSPAAGVNCAAKIRQKVFEFFFLCFAVRVNPTLCVGLCVYVVAHNTQTHTHIFDCVFIARSFRVCGGAHTIAPCLLCTRRVTIFSAHRPAKMSAKTLRQSD